MADDIVFDKAKWHIGGDFPKDLDNFQGYVHTGFYWGWLVINDMLDEFYKQEFINEIALFSKEELSPVQFFQDQLDGVFDSGYLTQNAIEFHYCPTKNSIKSPKPCIC